MCEFSGTSNGRCKWNYPVPGTHSIDWVSASWFSVCSPVQIINTIWPLSSNHWATSTRHATKFHFMTSSLKRESALRWHVRMVWLTQSTVPKGRIPHSPSPHGNTVSNARGTTVIMLFYGTMLFTPIRSVNVSSCLLAFGRYVAKAWCMTTQTRLTSTIKVKSGTVGNPARVLSHLVRFQ